MSSPILNKRIYHLAKTLHNKKRFPSYVSGAEYRTTRKVAKSGDIKKEDFVLSLERSLAKFGELGDKYAGSSIGFCAETVSANRVLQVHPTRFNNISIGKVIRPRTMQFGKKCKICNSLF